MKPSYQQVRQHFPKSETREQLYTALGWTDIINHPAYEDTCAIRMSYALLRANVVLPGATMRVKAGEAAGKLIQHRQRALSDTLARIWGAPEVYTNADAARKAIGNRVGVISFFKIERGSGGHIDLLSLETGGLPACVRSCYFSARTIWFWPLR